jgi:uncharacterized protein (TIGR00251 family)
MSSFYSWHGDTLTLCVLGKPGARRDSIAGVHGGELKVTVTAAAEDGKATDHMVRFLAREFGVSPSAVEVLSGRTSPHKRLRIHSPRMLPSGIVRPPTAPD